MRHRARRLLRHNIGPDSIFIPIGITKMKTAATRKFENGLKNTAARAFNFDPGLLQIIAVEDD